MKDEKIKELTNLLINIIKKSTEIYYHKNFFERTDKHKFEDDDVTNLDIQTQEFIVTECKKIIPGLSIIGEEGKEINNSPYELIIDPIDGTVNFKNRISMHGTQICLTYSKEPMISVLYLPEFKDIYYANKFGAFKNEDEIKVKSMANLKEVVISMGDFSKKNIEIWQKHFLILTNNVKRIRMFGGSCFDSCMLAGGNTMGYIVYTENLWDLMPGRYLMKMAGGVEYYNKEKHFYIYGSKNVVELLKNCLGLN